ncbi:MAG: DUF86 domain-containing protein [Thermodesulfovibrionales bacterium]|nr:DUF86 domain-containing protein [Thermodesulfovibrionales bacterium]
MTDRDYRDYLNDIVESVNDIETFIKGLSYEDFIADKKTFNAVVRSIEIIGEASTNLSKDICDKAPDIPWAKMKGMRNRLTHEYFGIDGQILWKTASESIPALKAGVENLLRIIEA